jgi:hypothetical protein
MRHIVTRTAELDAPSGARLLDAPSGAELDAPSGARLLDAPSGAMKYPGTAIR